MAVSVSEVKRSFERYGLLDDRVRFLEGWFKDTCRTPRSSELAIMRLDGDMYESTMDALASLYPRLSLGGYVIVDDFHLEGAKTATFDYRERHCIDDVIVETGSLGCVFWRRTR